MKKSKLYAPIRYAMLYLFSTFSLFAISDLSSGANNMLLLTCFVFFAYAFLYIGYVFGMRASATKSAWPADIDSKRIRYVNYLVVFGCVYLVVWGVNQTINYGAQDVSSVAEALANPGAAYAAKFEVYEEQQRDQKVSLIGQVLVLLGVVYVLVMPVMSAYWQYLTKAKKFFCVSSVFVYAISFLYIGTQKGLGDLFLMSFAGWAVVKCRDLNNFASIKRLRRFFLVLLLAVAGLVSLSLIQASRAVQFGITSSMMSDTVSDTWIAHLFGEYFALGFYTIISYPAHGYLGLSHNLGTDFVFSYGAGLFQAFESYRYQYLGGENNLLLTYPYRTEAITGWPAGMYWSTAFPWIASDLTFFGVFPLMFFVGVLFAKTWVHCLRTMDMVSLAVLGQIFLFIAFIPANNQVFISRQGFLAVFTLALIIIVRKLSISKRGAGHAN